MSTRSEALAQRVEQANKGLMSAVEGTADDQWKARLSEGDWTQGFAGYHAATSMGTITGLVQALAAGQPVPPISLDQVNEGNGQLWKAKGDSCTRQETLELLRKHGPEVVGMVRGLTDEQLDRKVSPLTGMPEMTIEQLADTLLAGHPTGHTESILKSR